MYLLPIFIVYVVFEMFLKNVRLYQTSSFENILALDYGADENIGSIGCKLHWPNEDGLMDPDVKDVWLF